MNPFPNPPSTQFDAATISFLPILKSGTYVLIKTAKNRGSARIPLHRFDKHEFHRLQRILKELHRSCMTDSGQDDQKKGTQLLELYSLEIQVAPFALVDALTS